MTGKAKTAYQALSMVQASLNAPKGQHNKFGNYNYRSCEDILQAVKPLLGEAVILVSDEIKMIGDRFYVEATAKFVLGDTVIENKAYAREPLSKKGMDEAQVTGATSSYARKYALNGLLLIDDNKDADTQKPEDNCSVTRQKAVERPAQKLLSRNTSELLALMNEGNDFAVAEYWRKSGQEVQQRMYSELDKETQKALKELLKNVPAQMEKAS